MGGKWLWSGGKHKMAAAFSPVALISENWQHKSVGNFVTKMGGAPLFPVSQFSSNLFWKIVDAVSVVLLD